MKEMKISVYNASVTNSDYNQKIAKPVRSQIPSDVKSCGMPRWKPGQLPTGGFRSVFDFSTGPESTKISKTSGGGGKVY